MPRQDLTPSADAADAKPSKTRRKKDMHELQALGEALLELAPAKLDALPMPERLRDALHELRRIRAHEGRRRQLQYIGKLMREADPEPLREAVAAQRLPSARQALALHQAEAWRDRLVADDASLTRWLDEHPQADAQWLRTVIRAARREVEAAQAVQPAPGAAARKGRAYRDLFQHVHEALAAADRDDENDEDDDHDDDHDAQP